MKGKAMTHFSTPVGILLALCLVTGCRDKADNNPTVNPPFNATVTIDGQQLAKAMEVQFAEQMKKRMADLERTNLILLIDGQRDQEHRTQIQSRAEALLDKSSGNWHVSTMGGYGSCYKIQISPVADVEVAAAKIDFGAVLAVDIVKRTIVVDVGAEAAPRPKTGWPGADAVRAYIGRQLGSSFAKDASFKRKKAELGDSVVVGYPRESAEDEWAKGIDMQLQKLAAEQQAKVVTVDSYQTLDPYRVAILEPIADPAAITAALANEVQWHDESERLLVLQSPVPLDLLTLVDLAKDIVAGDWKWSEKGKLLLGPGTRDAKLAFPVRPSGDYRFTVKFKRPADGGGPILCLPVGDRHVNFALDAYSGQFTALEAVDGAYVNFPNNPTQIRGKHVVTNQSHTLEAVVLMQSEMATIRVSLDGNRLVDWTGNPNRFTLHPAWRLSDDRQLGLRSWQVFEFESAQLKMLTGQANPIRP